VVVGQAGRGRAGDRSTTEGRGLEPVREVTGCKGPTSHERRAVMAVVRDCQAGGKGGGERGAGRHESKEGF